MKILRINPKDTLSLRKEVLAPQNQRDQYSLEDFIFARDEDDQTFHLGGFADNNLVSIASFYFEKHPKIKAPYQYRLRGMATKEQYRGKGFSSALLKTGFPIVKQNLCELLWCNARISALGFYEKTGFEKFGKTFDIPQIGQHIVMIKTLN